MESFTTAHQRQEAWLARDLALLNDAAAFAPMVNRADLQVGRRPLPDDPNRLFRWRLPRVAAPADVVFAGFVTHILDYHHEWTREFVDGYVVEQLSPTARVVYQRFEPGIPGIAKRDVCALEVTRELAPGVKLASFRSVDRLPPAPGYARIDWWGGALCTTLDGGQTSELIYLDRENQGGWLPAWLVNRTMKQYLVTQAEQVQRFFADGGPMALRRPEP